MYQFLVLSSYLEGEVAALKWQIDYLEGFGISVTLSIDPTEIELLKLLSDCYFDCAYIHIKRRTFANNEKQYDPAKIIEQNNVPLLGNSYITQMFIADKYTTSKKSGIGLPNHLIGKSAFNEDLFDWDTINDYPVIVKPNTFHASMGITEKSIVWKQAALKKAVQCLFDDYPVLNEVLIEKFAADGQEYTVSVLGNGDSMACSVSKLQYKPEVSLRINSRRQKELAMNQRSFAFKIEEDPKIRERLVYHAKTLFRHFRMKDIARFDFVLDKTYYLLEANTCPIPGNSFTWEWQEKYGVKKEHIIALYLCAFHFGQIASGRLAGSQKF